MKGNQIWIHWPGRLLLLVALVIGLSPGVVRAEDFIGAFTLPIEVRWGLATLPAGDYTFRINPEVAPNMAAITGKNGTVFVLPAGSRGRFSGRSSLVLVRRGRTGVVREMQIAIPGLKPSYGRSGVRVYDRGSLVSNVETQTPNQGGVTLIYSTPKGEPALTAQTPELIQRIPILLASK